MKTILITITIACILCVLIAPSNLYGEEKKLLESSKWIGKAFESGETTSINADLVDIKSKADKKDLSKSLQQNSCLLLPEDYTTGILVNVVELKQLPPIGAIRMTDELMYCYYVESCFEYSMESGLPKHSAYWFVKYKDCLDSFSEQTEDVQMIEKIR